MKIVHVTYRYDTIAAGIKRSVESLAAAQNQLPDLDVWIYSAKEKVLTAPNGDKATQSFVEMLALKPALVIYHSIYKPVFYWTSLALRHSKIPYAVKPHGSLNRRAQKKSPIKKNLAHWLWIDRWLSKAAGLIFLCQEEEADSRFRPERRAILPNTYPLTLGQTQPSQWEDDRVRLMMLSRIVPRHKGIDRFLKSLAALPKKSKDQILVEIYGMGRKKNLDWLQDSIAAMSDLDIRFHGPVYKEQKDKAYAKGGIFCMFSRSEGMPLTLYEAAAHGMPVLVTLGSNRANWVRQEKCGWVLLDSQEADWGQKLAGIIDDYQSHCQQYRQKARKAAEALPTWQAIAQESVLVYGEWGKQR